MQERTRFASLGLTIHGAPAARTRHLVGHPGSFPGENDLYYSGLRPEPMGLLCMADGAEEVQIFSPVVYVVPVEVVNFKTR